MNTAPDNNCPLQLLAQDESLVKNSHPTYCLYPTNDPLLLPQDRGPLVNNCPITLSNLLVSRYCPLYWCLIVLLMEFKLLLPCTPVISWYAHKLFRYISPRHSPPFFLLPLLLLLIPPHSTLIGASACGKCPLGTFYLCSWREDTSLRTHILTVSAHPSTQLYYIRQLGPCQSNQPRAPETPPPVLTAPKQQLRANNMAGCTVKFL